MTAIEKFSKDIEVKNITDRLIKEFDFSLVDRISVKKFNRTKNLCVVYHALSSFSDLKWIYLSMVSQHDVTDFAEFPRFLVVNKELKKYGDFVTSMENQFGLDIVWTDYQTTYQNQFLFDEYDVVVHVDSKTIFFGSNTSLYSKLMMYYNFVSRIGFSFPLFFPKPFKKYTTEHKFYIEALKSDIDEDEWFDWWSLLLKIGKSNFAWMLKSKTWPENYFVAYDNSIFDSKEWDNLTKNLADITSTSKDLAYLMWAWKNNIDISYISSFDGIECMGPYINEIKQTGHIIDNIKLTQLSDKLYITYPFSDDSDYSLDNAKEVLNHIIDE